MERQPVRVARGESWRAWQASLSRRVPPSGDELPEVVLPERLFARIGEAVDADLALAHAADWPLARTCELAACGLGRTLEALVLELVLAGGAPEAGRRVSGSADVLQPVDAQD
jgi:hypothetical protein